MRIAVTGSIAMDHLMAYPGRFADHLLADRLDRVSLSFLAEGLEIRRGGVGANIALGLGRLGVRPLLAGAVGPDFGEYREWLEANGVDTGPVLVSDAHFTARFVCTTDSEQNQIATFYAGAMAAAREIRLAPLARVPGGLDLVVVAPDDPAAMVRHTEEARALGVPFAADPSQQLARLSAEEARGLVDGAGYLFTNEYEAGLLRKLTGWDEPEILARVGGWLTTLGEKGVSLARAGEPPLTVPAVPARRIADPTGAGDAFRAGFLAGVAQGQPDERAARLGCGLATLALESVGTQEYALDPGELLDRLAGAYGPAAAEEAAPLLRGAVPPGRPA
ncbi:carbohydrate kinase family protein [Streptomyces sp. LP05-1]|uniref:Carbohydrate kinase family protein n=1 Tax=Streptomyces pyxinae TaxID=2970734 RepID=A0ABT2CMJ8_9ACTN|nr:carbohydrate kinase family protein [Streptomyces sp. LP05-1]MCS0638648.1 carbohydrate kinase family protein [Streptomyces sp. LP05-1]